MKIRKHYCLLLPFLVLLAVALSYLPAQAQDTESLAKKLAEVDTGTSIPADEHPRVQTFVRLLDGLEEEYEEDVQTIATLTLGLHFTLEKKGRGSSLEELMSAFHGAARAGLIRDDQYAEVTKRYLRNREEDFSHQEAMSVLYEGRPGQGFPLLVN